MSTKNLNGFKLRFPMAYHKSSREKGKTLGVMIKGKTLRKEAKGMICWHENLYLNGTNFCRTFMYRNLYRSQKYDWIFINTVKKLLAKLATGYRNFDLGDVINKKF